MTITHRLFGVLVAIAASGAPALACSNHPPGGGGASAGGAVQTGSAQASSSFSFSSGSGSSGGGSGRVLRMQTSGTSFNDKGSFFGGNSGSSRSVFDGVGRDNASESERRGSSRRR